LANVIDAAIVAGPGTRQGRLRQARLQHLAHQVNLHGRKMHWIAIEIAHYIVPVWSKRTRKGYLGSVADRTAGVGATNSVAVMSPARVPALIDIERSSGVRGG